MQNRRRGKEGKGGDRHGNRRDLFLKVHDPEGMGGVQVVSTGHLLCLYFSKLPWDPQGWLPVIFTYHCPCWPSDRKPRGRQKMWPHCWYRSLQNWMEQREWQPWVLTSTILRTTNPCLPSGMEPYILPSPENRRLLTNVGYRLGGLLVIGVN